MNAGEIDVRCYISPAWLSHDFPGYRWSVALLVQRDILVAREGFAPIPEALPASVSVPSLATAIPACKRCSTSADCAATMRAPRIWCWKSCAPAATATRSAINCRCTGATARRRAAATPGSRAARRDGGELHGAGLRRGSGGSDTEDVRGNEAQREIERYCSATDKNGGGVRKMAGLKWRRPRQPHPGTQCPRLGCFLPDLTR